MPTASSHPDNEFDELSAHVSHLRSDRPTLMSPHAFKGSITRYLRASPSQQQQLRELNRGNLTQAQNDKLFEMMADPKYGYQVHAAQHYKGSALEKYLYQIDLRTYDQLRLHGIEIPAKYVNAQGQVVNEKAKQKLLCLTHEIAELPEWSWPKGPWRPKHCIQMRECMIDFYSTGFGHLAVRAPHIEIAELWAEEDFELDNSPDAIHERVWERRAHWASPDLMIIHADENFATMADAAAMSAPLDRLAPDELLAHHGVIFFRNQVSLEVISPDVQIRAIFWRLLEADQTPDGEPIIMVDLLQDGATANPLSEGAEADIPGFYDTERYLRIKVPLALPLTGLDEVDEGLIGPVAFLRAMGQIAKSPKTRAEDVGIGRGERPAKKKSRRRRMNEHQDTVRTLSLREPSHARLEHNAATGTDSRVGAGVKQHYVRGHWRNQWYPSVQGHRALWIDGFVKGDPSLGTVSSPAVHLARSPKDTTPVQP